MPTPAGWPGRRARPSACATAPTASSDWPILNALLNTASHADLVAVHGFGGFAQSAGATTVADGTAQAAERLGAVLTNDPGIGVLRHADAGYETAIETAARAGLGL